MEVGHEHKESKRRTWPLAGKNGMIIERGEVDAVWIIFCGFLAA